MELKIVLPDGSEKAVKKGVKVREVLESFLTKETLGAKFNGQIFDLETPITEEGTFEKLLTPEDPESLELLRHTAAHVMAQAVKELFPEAKLGIGPTIENGFYYDFDYERSFTPEDLKQIEKRMKKIIKKRYPLVREEISKEEAKKLFSDLNEPYKLELIEEIPGDTVSIYRQGEFVDLCAGPHLPHTGWVKAFKLLSVAGAYWRGDENNPMLWRIYGAAFFKKEELEAYLEKLEEAKRRDHRRLGKELELFSIEEEVGPGLILWHPKGALVRKIIEDFWREEHLKRGYELVVTPHIARRHLWQISGHLDFYAENMFAPMKIDEIEYQLKPMNCPFHILIYKSRRRSYRELPIRWCELGTVYRYERSGVLHGLMRVRGFTQDDAHIFCREDQLEEEIFRCLDLTVFFLSTFGFKEYQIFLSTRPEKYVGDEAIWEKAEGALRKALEDKGLPYEIDPGEGVFYGPKIDIKIKDVLGRFWQCSTIQVDFNIPERFNLTYIGEDNQRHRPIMIHRALLGSLERFLGVLIEHYAGAFPVWLAPVQAIIITVADRHIPFAEQVLEHLKGAGIRVKPDFRNEKLGFKIREAQLQKIPYMIIIGDKELENKALTIRTRKGENLPLMSTEDFVAKVQEEVSAKTLN
ncbi:threonyl-tRNA synthetase [Thermodesulfatator indicus DSM 15286]|uniref:Threonine--tRNA ligase n=1 Tax=Thermodesulfatator indicus (strain DSM 15286 / JCM 11887 / CIR29812) TaxID=667014 RepID=F8AAU1_THEID|nr:threonine--tRNA ligase [Thermodesulfatator indicus]AEH45452.1 threonyl-tRNA synthetase [Thermodesulfatator indicus DSM 15286]